MVDPVHALLIAGVLVFVGCAVLRPDRGYLWRWLRYRRVTERVLSEDALKHLYDCELRRCTATVESISGSLSVSGNRSVEILARLETQRLLHSVGGAFLLTSDGRDYALRIIRIHRLLEHYLSEETGLHQLDWHREAERREHHVSPSEADALAARLGNPLYDPHGDPIPTAAGNICYRDSKPLTDLPVGELARIVHLEDEPDAVFAQLIAEGLHPGMHVLVDEITPDRIRFRADGDGHVLAPVVAANVSVLPVSVPKQEMTGPFESLSMLNAGQRGIVKGISHACRGLERNRLMDLGLVPGTAVEVEMIGPGKSLIAYRIRGAVIALRREQADLIHLEPQEVGAAS